MRLNFWQWIGLALLVVGAILYFARTTSNDAPGGGTGRPSGAATTQSH